MLLLTVTVSFVVDVLNILGRRTHPRLPRPIQTFLDSSSFTVLRPRVIRGALIAYELLWRFGYKGPLSTVDTSHAETCFLHDLLHDGLNTMLHRPDAMDKRLPLRRGQYSAVYMARGGFRSHGNMIFASA